MNKNTDLTGTQTSNTILQWYTLNQPGGKATSILSGIKFSDKCRIIKISV